MLSLVEGHMHSHVIDHPIVPGVRHLLDLSVRLYEFQDLWILLNGEGEVSVDI